MVQNHLMQLFSLTAMEPPNSLDADSIRNEKVKVVQATRLANLERLEYSATRGQYTQGWMKGKNVPAYREEGGADSNSTTPTYAALNSILIIGAGKEYHFICGLVSECQKKSQKLQFNLKKYHF